MHEQVLVVVGVGGMGQVIARRQGAGKTVLIADFDEKILESAADTLRDDGHEVTARRVDVSSHESVTALAEEAATLGSVVQVVHTAGLGPDHPSIAAILDVNLAGAAFSLAEFGRVIAPGGAGVLISSMSGQLTTPLTADQETALIHTPADELLALDFAGPTHLTDPVRAYGFSKRANQLRVQAASVSWGERGARINAISPGIIATPMTRRHLTAEAAEPMHAMINASAAGRLGTPDDIAAAAAFLLGPESAFITGADLLVDGGAIAAVRAGRLTGRG